jgi:hypothetical protein
VITQNFRSGWKSLPETNDLAYLTSLSVTKKDDFMAMSPGSNVFKLFRAIIYKCSCFARVFVLGRTFQLTLMFVGEVRSLTRKHKARLERPARVQQTGSLRTLVNCRRKKIYGCVT